MKPVPEISEVTRPYWQAAAEGRLMLPRCNACDGVQHPPRDWCPHCWSKDLTWTEMSGRGVVLTFSVVHQPPSEGFDVPYVLAVVKLEEGPQMMCNIVDCAPGDVRVDMAVAVTFEARGDIALPQFRKAGS